MNQRVNHQMHSSLDLKPREIASRCKKNREAQRTKPRSKPNQCPNRLHLKLLPTLPRPRTFILLMRFMLFASNKLALSEKPTRIIEQKDTLFLLESHNIAIRCELVYQSLILPILFLSLFRLFHFFLPTRLVFLLRISLLASLFLALSLLVIRISIVLPILTTNLLLVLFAIVFILSSFPSVSLMS